MITRSQSIIRNKLPSAGSPATLRLRDLVDLVDFRFTEYVAVVIVPQKAQKWQKFLLQTLSNRIRP